jgi:hypothetical protein
LLALYIVSSVIAALTGISLLRVGIIAEYGDNKFSVNAKIGPLTIKLYPREPKEKKPKKEEEKKEATETTGKEKGLTKFKTTFRRIRNVLDNNWRRLRIDELTVHYMSASDDFSRAAMNYGRATAAAGIILPILENNFTIKKCDIGTAFSFETSEPYIYVRAKLSLAVWEFLNIAKGLATEFRTKK